MTIPHWQLQTPMDAILFDCDGTLSTIEGIDELARNNHVFDPVRALTENAMARTGLTPTLYQQRLDLVKPSQQAVLSLGEKYFQNRTPDSHEVITLFSRLNKPVYILSAGLLPAVARFGNLLGIPSECIFAVDIQFDPEGQFKYFDHHSPLVQMNGKRMIVEKLKKCHSQILFVGDGLNDLDAYDLVSRFVGYGGSFYRENIANACEFYLTTPFMAALLPLALTMQELAKLNASEQALYEKGLAHLGTCMK